MLEQPCGCGFACRALLGHVLAPSVAVPDVTLPGSFEDFLVDAESRRGNCLDNAAMESWNSTLKIELGEDFESPADAKAKLFDFIEVFYNQTRLHSSLDYCSPAEFERNAFAMRPAA